MEETTSWPDDTSEVSLDLSVTIPYFTMKIMGGTDQALYHEDKFNKGKVCFYYYYFF